MSTTSTRRTDRVAATREAIISAAERLFAEQGIQAVSNRQISEAAGQGNNAAVGYHFGGKNDLIQAIVRKHVARMEPLREERLQAIGDSADLHDWVECLIMPITDYFGTFEGVSWFARFGAQIQTDPQLRSLMDGEATRAESLERTAAGMKGCMTHLPEDVVEERFRMMRMLLVFTPASRESALAKGDPAYGSSWREAGEALVDAVVGLLQAPHTKHHKETARRTP